MGFAIKQNNKIVIVILIIQIILQILQQGQNQRQITFFIFLSLYLYIYIIVNFQGAQKFKFRLLMKYLLTSYSSQPSKNKTGSIRQLSPQQYNVDNHFLLLTNPNIRIVCDTCSKNITITCHIASEDFDYCVACFTSLEQYPDSYYVRSTMLYSLTDPEWLCLDELLLLTAFQKWGFGNWGQVKDYMNFNGSKFGKSQIQEHYDHYYLSSGDLSPNISNQIIISTKDNNAKSAIRFQPPSVHPNPKKAPLPQFKSQDLLSHPPHPSHQSHSSRKPPTTASTTPSQNILGYNPKRKCFYYDLEYDQKAEVMLADLEFKDDDTPEEIQLKFKIIQSYNKRLDQRLRRYQFTIQHHILDIDYRFRKEFSADKYQKQAFQLYRPFTRFQTHQQNQQTMHLIALNNYHKSLIQTLKKCRKKIDKQGKIQTTLQYLNSKQDSTQKLGHPRKVYHISLEGLQGSEKGNGAIAEEDLVRKFEEVMKRNDQSETPRCLKIVYRSKGKGQD